MAGPSFDRVVEQLERVKGRDGDVIASCPVPSHGQGRGDTNPSLHVTFQDGKTLLACQAGCDPQDVLLALGLEWSDLFDVPLTDRGHLVNTWTYQRPDGAPYHRVERWETATGKRFVQRVEGQEKPGYPKGFQPALFDLPRVLAAAKAGEVIYVVEGEKCVSAARHLGLVATCGPNGAKGWRNYYWHWLAGASEIVVIADNDEVGKNYAAEVVADLRGHNVKCRVLGVCPAFDKADLYDHVKAGFGLLDLVPLNVNRLRPVGNSMNTIMTSDYPPVRWAVKGLISAGLTLLGGPPKIGKSYITLDLGMGVACGGRAMSALECEQGSVLMLSLDNDAEWRIQERAHYLLGGIEPTEAIPIEVHTEWPTGLAALAACQEWANEVDNPLMIIIDTLIRAEPSFGGDARQDAYTASVDVLSRWSKFGMDQGIAVVAVHHDRKGNQNDRDMDWLDRFLGSRGITATAQTLLMVDAKRGEHEGILRVSGRDVATEDLDMRRNGRLWICMDTPRIEPPFRRGLRIVK